jgi:hypothetical protein
MSLLLEKVELIDGFVNVLQLDIEFIFIVCFLLLLFIKS